MQFSSLYKHRRFLVSVTRKFSCVIFFYSLFFPATPNENHPLGSRAAAMGNSAVTIFDIWAVYHNQAGLAGINSTTAAIHYENRFNISEFGLRAAVMAIPARPGTIGFSYSFFGFAKYYESKAGIAFGRYFGEKVAAGLQINYLHTFIAEDYGSTGSLTAEGGFIAEPVERLLVAAHVYNPTGTKIKTHYSEPVPTIFRFGMAYRFGRDIFASVEAQKEIDRKVVFRAGVEAGFLGSFFLRTGITSDPAQNSFGLGYFYRGLNADIAFTNHQVLGFTPHISVSYTF